MGRLLAPACGRPLAASPRRPVNAGGPWSGVTATARCILGPACPQPRTYLVGSLSHELLGGLFPDGRHCDNPSDIRVLEL